MSFRIHNIAQDLAISQALTLVPNIAVISASANNQSSGSFNPTESYTILFQNTTKAMNGNVGTGGQFYPNLYGYYNIDLSIGVNIEAGSATSFLLIVSNTYGDTIQTPFTAATGTVTTVQLSGALLCREAGDDFFLVTIYNNDSVFGTLDIDGGTMNITFSN